MEKGKRRRQKNTFRGQLEGDWLAGFLTDKGNADSKDLVLSVLEDVCKLVGYSVQRRNGDFDVKDKDRREFDGRAVALNKRLAQYKEIALGIVWFGRDTWTLGPIYLPPKRRVTDKRRYDWFDQFRASPPQPRAELEFAAIQRIIALAKAGLPDRVRLCLQCKEGWFFARFANHYFCSAPCRKAEHQSSPEHKAERAHKAREKYSVEKELDQRNRERNKREAMQRKGR